MNRKDEIKEAVARKLGRQKNGSGVSRSENREEKVGLSRRSVLGSIATGVGGSAVVSTSFSDSVTAAPDVDQETERRMKNAAEEYSTGGAVRRAVNDHAQELLQKLSRRGLLDAESTDDLPTDRLLSKEEYADSNEGTLVVGVLAEDDPTAHIMIKTDLDDRELVIIVEPHVDRSFATVSGNDSTETEFIHTSPSTATSCTCATGEACIYYCHPSDGCGCSHYEVECCPNCCECHRGSLVPGGTCDCHQDCWEATNCSCT